MSERNFDIRLFGAYQDDGNKLASLKVEIFKEDEWKTLALDTRTPAFVIFDCALTVSSSPSCDQSLTQR